MKELRVGDDPFSVRLMGVGKVELEVEVYRTELEVEVYRDCERVGGIYKGKEGEGGRERDANKVCRSVRDGQGKCK